jgi:dUTP pyrophosphatase
MPPVSIAYTLAPGARAPTRATPGAAGMDLHAYLPDGGPLVLPPGDWAHIPTGVSLALPPGYEGQVRPRSGLAWKRGVTVLNAPGTIDADYRGDLGVLLVNHGNDDFAVEHGDRIAQLVVCPVADAALTAADSLPPTARGADGFGSTGTGPVDPWTAGYRAGYDDATEDRALLEARVRSLEAEVLEARAERDKWAAELDALRAGGAR